MVLELQLNTIKIPGVSQHWQSVTVTVAGPGGCDSPGPGSAIVRQCDSGTNIKVISDKKLAQFLLSLRHHVHFMDR